MLSDYLQGLVGTPTGGPDGRIRGAAVNSLQPCGRPVGQAARQCVGRRGAAATEMALVLPVFIMLILGMFELGRALMIKQSLTYAAQDACRVAILDGSTLASVRSKATASLQPIGIVATSVTVTTDPTAPSSGGYNTPVSVTVSVPYADVSIVPSTFIPGTAVLSVTVTMRRETVK